MKVNLLDFDMPNKRCSLCSPAIEKLQLVECDLEKPDHIKAATTGSVSAVISGRVRRYLMLLDRTELTQVY